MISNISPFPNELCATLIPTLYAEMSIVPVFVLLALLTLTKFPFGT